MTRTLLILFLGLGTSALAACQPASRDTQAGSTSMSTHADTGASPGQIAFVSMTGDTITLNELGGKAWLVVNVASKCGMTPQYEGLEELYRTYKDRGLVVVGFPCNQFGGQEPGSDQEILQFCRTQYDVTFPVMSKLEVKGDGQHPLYRYLTRSSERPGEIQWNFTKFLLDSTGHTVARFEPAVTPLSEQVTSAVEALL